MKEFLFQPEQSRTPIRNLSGGERARLMLARILSRPTNLLILDEPTNDLDIETLDLLQEIVAGFAGTVLLVSHDRDFLDRTVPRPSRRPTRKTRMAAGSNMPAAIPT
jgi:ABC transport system ATP-binding/permease protein